MQLYWRIKTNRAISWSVIHWRLNGFIQCYINSVWKIDQLIARPPKKKKKSQWKITKLLILLLNGVSPSNFNLSYLLTCIKYITSVPLYKFHQLATQTSVMSIKYIMKSEIAEGFDQNIQSNSMVLYSIQWQTTGHCLCLIYFCLAPSPP